MFLAKILERIASSQLRAYLDEYKLLPEMQSAYRQFHSTETALIKVFNDVLLAVDKGQEAVVVLLDFFRCI